jgi:hypothetical protein
MEPKGLFAFFCQILRPSHFTDEETEATEVRIFPGHRGMGRGGATRMNPRDADSA